MVHKKHTRRGGFTLVELMTAGAISTIALAAMSITFISNARMYQNHQTQRVSQSNARQATAFMERAIRTAGYGVDPSKAFIAWDSYDAVSNTLVAGYPDAISVFARDLNFRRSVAAFNGSTQLTFSRPLKSPLVKGQILLAICYGAKEYAYFTVSKTAPANPTIPQPTVDVELYLANQPETPISSPGVLFHGSNKIGPTGIPTPEIYPPCINNPTTDVVKIERNTFYIAAHDDDGATATDAVPYLMLHQGLDVNNDQIVNEKDALPLASGIEQLQIAYVLNELQADAPLVLGGVLGVDGQNARPGPTGPAWNLQPTCSTKAYDPSLPNCNPAMTVPYTHGSRESYSPANIRQVRLSIVARGPYANIDTKSGTDLLLHPAPPNGPAALAGQPMLENLVASTRKEMNPQAGGFQRTLVRLTVAPKNLLLRTQFSPTAENGG
jgi:type IV pilus assembly protein PilW